MGLPFPLGLAWLERDGPQLVPWAWAINGCTSVVASVLAAILAMSQGFSAVQLLGAAAYGLAWLVLFLPRNQTETQLPEKKDATRIPGGALPSSVDGMDFMRVPV